MKQFESLPRQANRSLFSRRCVLPALSVLFSISALLLTSPSTASVTQVDGSILPAGSALQTALNTEEGFSPPNAQAISAVVDASLLPEFFLPDVNKIVTFKDIAEGAGFENSFGYYNVGDDVNVLTNLHPIMGCGVAAAIHTTEAAGYFVNAEPGSIASINFATELAAGRYKGGFVGFYLITPEGNPSANNCGDFVTGSDGLSLLGKIYFTERDLNNDGDFVHSMVYKSKRLDKPDRFYFGFEDLFRGGDNDFEDMAMQVNGLTAPCQPIAETCNNKDDDCDGIVDNSPFDVGDSCSSGVGVCLSTSVTACVNGIEVCTAIPGLPQQELCNGLDDDCDGVTDDAPSNIGASCSSGIGECRRTGATICSGGFVACGAIPGSPAVERCDSKDNDCDGLTDEDFSIGAACDGLGACGIGSFECATEFTKRCSTDIGGTQDQSIFERCDGLDNDCDGQSDEGSVDVGNACTVGLGICQRSGTTICANGGELCNAVPGVAQQELCNGLDDDCDGQVDEDFLIGSVCTGLGECGFGVFECKTTTSAICSTAPGGSQDQSRSELCDSKDNDCDGTVDEGLSDLGACGFNETGECADGRLRCSAGQVECVGEVGPTLEFCDGLDNDCDGTVDDNPIDDGDVCGTDLGECGFGQQFCVAGTLACVGAVLPSAELCDGLDNDCNGLVDNDLNDPTLNQPCGLDLGECDPGVTTCLDGAKICLGGTLPQNEVCDNLDNNCDGTIDDSPIDIGQPCGSSFGVCSPGITECSAGALVCEGEINPLLPETCNGFDDDCDGFIDDAATDAGASCGLDVGECVPGVLVCTAGGLACQGGIGPRVEVCNGLDDDCDGDIDELPEVNEPDLCQAPSQCIQAECRVICDAKSPTCAGGDVCLDVDQDGSGFCVPNPCNDVVCDAPQACDILDGQCRLPCESFPCAEGFVCDATDGQCREDNCYSFGCQDGELCLDATCVVDVCEGKSCGAGQYCDRGECKPSCEGVSCAPGQRCDDGACVEDKCFGVACSNERDVCDPATGECLSSCRAVVCGNDRVCDPQTGECIDDPCIGVVCSEDGECRGGQCFTANSSGFVATGGAGCAVSQGDEGQAGLWMLLCLLPILLRKRLQRLVLLLGVMVFFSACKIVPFFVIGDGTCVPDSETEICDLRDNDCDGIVDEECEGCAPTFGGTEFCDGIDNNCDGQIDEGCGNNGCVPSNDSVEACDEIDNDCDGSVDEGFDLAIDVENCGSCGNSCLIVGAFSLCNSGQCEFAGCAPGKFDTNNDLSDGCEYQCTFSNGALEACDGLDNDCDGAIDEDTDLSVDVTNCGFCGNVCGFFQAFPSCESGSCTFDPATDCRTITDPVTGEQTQFHDIDGDPNTGCEYACTPNPLDADPTAVEQVCNGLDDDCDGLRDDGFDLDTDPLNCGRCERVCSFPNVLTTACSVGVCTFNPATDCAVGTHDIDLNPINGCEYACVNTNNGVEICDGIDNDCDGKVDEAAEVLFNDPAVGAFCGQTAVGECQLGVTLCTAGLVRCVGEVGPTAERCDGKDNDCDGQTDELVDLVDVGRVCAQAKGECSFGLTACSSGALVCEQEIGPNPERCDGLDNDCDGFVDGTDSNGDGQVDTLPIDTAQGCGGGTVNGGDSQCVEGVSVCDQGVLQCIGSIDPSNESCDGVDNDCDGAVDDNASQVGDSCGSNLGECQAGTFACSIGILVCQNQITPSPELCDGKDNDCNGLPDDNISATSDARVGQSCGFSDEGACSLGSQICSSGQIFCANEIGPIGESCDGLDNDCDGRTDEDSIGATLTQGCYEGPNGTQGVGVCRAGARSCLVGSFSGACVSQVLPSGEVCDAKDNDCDGISDEADAGGPLRQACYSGPVGTENVGICRGGQSTCAAGVFGACVGEVLPASEICGDAINNDCDVNVSDQSEGCLVRPEASDLRLDALLGSGLASNAGVHHSFDTDIAISGNNVYAVFSDSRTGVPKIYLARSTDGGASFGTSLVLVADPGTLRDTSPQVVAFGNNVIVAFIRVRGAQGTRDVFVASSTDAGATFGTAVRMDTDDNIRDSFHFDLAAVQSGAVIKTALVWEELVTNNAALPRNIKIRRSKNAMAATPVYDAEQTLNKGAGNPIAGRPQVAFGGSDRIVSVWRETRAGGNGTSDIFSNFWDDASATANATDLRIDTDSSGAAQDDVPVIASLGSQIYVAWEDLKADGSDITFVRSTNNGTNFGAETTLDDGATELSTSLSPTMVAVQVGGQSRVYVAWEDDRDGTEIFVTRSLNGGQSFEGGKRASSVVNPTPGVSLAPKLAVDAGGRVEVSFTSSRSGKEDVFVAFSIDAGLTWQPVDLRADSDTAGAGASITPAIAAFANGVGVVWVDFRTGGTNGDIFFRRMTP